MKKYEILLLFDVFYPLSSYRILKVGIFNEFCKFLHRVDGG